MLLVEIRRVDDFNIFRKRGRTFTTGWVIFERISFLHGWKKKYYMNEIFTKKSEMIMSFNFVDTNVKDMH